MSSYNVSNTDGESIESFHQLSSQSFKQIILKDIPSNVHFVVVQAHSHLANVTLSYDKKPQPSTSVTGTNVGLVKVNYNEEIFFYLMCSSCANETKVLIAVQAYDNKGKSN